MTVDAKMAALAKDKAEALFNNGKLKEALDTYDHISSFGDKDPRIYIRMGDIARKLEDNAAAIEHYKKAVKAFVKTGFVIKAIAVCKMIISIDPSQQDIQARLAELAAAGGAVAPAGPPKTAPAKPQAAQPAPQIRLPKVPLFSDFNEEEFLSIVKKVKAVHVPKDSFLFHEGDKGDSIFFVSEGEVDVIGHTKGGEERSFARLKEGDVFGEFGFFSNSERSTGVKAFSDATMLELTKADLDDIIKHHKRVGDVLINFYKERIVDRLMALSLVFQPLTANDRKDVLKCLAIVSYDKSSLITKEGEAGDTMYLIKEGKVAVWVKDAAGREKRLAEFEEGDFFGEIALATNKPRTANVTALSDVQLVEFSRTVIKDILAKYPAVKTILERVIKERVSGVVSAREHRGTMI